LELPICIFVESIFMFRSHWLQINLQTCILPYKKRLGLAWDESLTVWDQAGKEVPSSDIAMICHHFAFWEEMDSRSSYVGL
jgi:hypothetical protein